MSLKIKKIIPYLLILVILAGILSPLAQVSAQSDQSEVAKAVEQKSCIDFTNVDLGGCLVKIANFIFHDIAGFLLWVAGIVFNSLISLTLSSALYFNEFIPAAWTVVRDFSNIFFILVLLYVALQTILGFGHEVKKIIVHVVVMALLINFSMFFTKIVIDSSNILALIFYNKIEVETRVDGKPRPYSSVTGEKDVSGGLVAAFDPTRSVSQETLTKARQTWKDGKLVNEVPTVPTGTLLALILVSGLLMYLAIYAFFISGLSFLGRLIELWVLIIFSPFAFMSWIIPKLSGVEYIGWSAWIHRLLKTSFMAPIFMFFLYLIFRVVQAKPFDTFVKQTNGENGLIATLLSVIIPALVISALLLKATEYAKKGGGQFGQMAISGAKLVAGLAIGGAALGVAAVGRGTAGAVAKSVQSTKATREKAFTFKETREKWQKPGLVNKFKAIGSLNEGIGKAAVAGVAELLYKTPKIAGKTVGEHIQAQDEGYGHKTHATHILDAKTRSEFEHQYGEDVKFKDLTEPEQRVVKEQVDLDEMSKLNYNKQFKDLEAAEGAEIKDLYKHGGRVIVDEHGKSLRIDDSAHLAPGERLKSDYFVDMSKTNSALGEFVQALRKGTYDVRNLPEVNAKSKGIFPKVGVGTVALIASGIRLGLKKGGGVEYGSVKGDYIKDLGETISSALKNVKINISGGEGHGGDDHGTKEVKSVGH